VSVDFFEKRRASAVANQTGQPEEFVIVPTRNEDGAQVFAVLVKRTYAIRPGQAALRTERARPFVQADVYYDDGDPETSTVKYESELAPYKPATDVVVIGKAFAPRGKPVARLDVAVEVGGHKKVIRVTGDRHCLFRDNRPPTFTEPAEFTEMEVRYERAYGGKDERSRPELPFYYPRNPMGTGVAVSNTRAAVDGLVLPNLEDPGDLLTPERVVLGEPDRWNKQPLPQGLGWFQPAWYPRCSFVGSVPGFVDPDEVMREEALGLVPRGQIALARRFQLPSYDVRYNNGASLGLALPFLKGDEAVRLTHLTAEGDLRFTLPGDRPRISLDLGQGENGLDVVLHTVCVRLEDMQVDLVWRGAQVYPGLDWLPQMKKLVVKVA
jgi:hypothetical protein